jgi:NAD(P)-dependent dehydrogenase (short-subunit alcohol dehydrogenase family)
MGNRLQDKRCLIVGGTTGLGRAAAARFLEEGARIVIAGRSKSKGEEALASLREKGQVHFLTANAAVGEQVERLFHEATAALGGLDVLYHVAGASGRRFGDGPLHECSEGGWQATMEANLTSTFLTNRAAVRHLLAQRRPGAILNMTSVLSFAPSPRHFDVVAYAAAKGAIIALSRQAAARYAVHGIRINTLAPGVVDTPGATRTINDPAVQDFLRGKQPLSAGAARPEDVADAAVFLCSDAARLVTGIVLSVGGGWCVSEGQFSKAEG